MNKDHLNELKNKALEVLRANNELVDIIHKIERSSLIDPNIDLPGFTTPPAEKKSVLFGKQIALIPGHEPGGGAEGEREWNTDVAMRMNNILTSLGADPFIYMHKERNYSKRMQEMKDAIKFKQPSNWVCIELHYDAVDIPSPSGHHFQYLGSKALASAFRDVWQKKYPNSKPRRDNGIMYNNEDRGSGFLRAAPGWAVLCEPFFRSNLQEWAFFKNRHREVAETYVEALKLYATLNT